MEPSFIAHIRAHSGLPGPLVAGNDAVDRLKLPFLRLPVTNMLIFIPMLTDCTLNTIFFSLKRGILMKPVMSASLCTYELRFQELIPRGKQPNSLWQSCFTHCSLGKFSLLFVSVDTFSGFI